MDNWTLRLILIIIGLLILAAIVLFHRPGGSRKPHARRRASPRLEPGLGGAVARDPAETNEVLREPEDSPRQASLPALEASADRTGGETAAEHPETRREPRMATPAPRPGEGADHKIVTLYVKTRNERRISGLNLLDAAIKAGLSFGEMNIFHRRQEGEKRPVFSMANITPPGHFDPAGWNLFETPGVTLFMTLPGPLGGLDTWDAMLATGRRLAELLEADLLDDTRSVLSRARIARIREEMRDYDRRAGLG